ncbi:MAG: YfcE family phosphodiesterase [Clostridia bacterium]|nr:YfcE family phosphodiesterase [Clostridia bacterium]
MRLLVISDSHGSVRNCAEILRREPEAEAIFHLGDGVSDLETLSSLIGSRPVCSVEGNCDFDSPRPKTLEAEFGDVKVFACHGDMLYVRHDLDMLESAARGAGARLALYGHTHIQRRDHRDGLEFFNPGAAMSGFYGVVDIVPGGLICIGKSLTPSF